MNLVCIIDSEVLNKDDDIVVTQCGHVFHRQCIVEWLVSSNTCPNCRRACSASTLIKVFFDNDDNKAIDLHEELLRSNEKMSQELKEFREKANKQEAELIKTGVKYREVMEKVKNFERTKQLDDMMLASLRSIKDEATKEILKLSSQLKVLKLDLLAERELRRKHQQTLHKLDPLNENYDANSIQVDDENGDLGDNKPQSSTAPAWTIFNTDNVEIGGTKKKDFSNYVIPAKIQRANIAVATNQNGQRRRSDGSDFTFKRTMKDANQPPDGPAFTFAGTSSSSSSEAAPAFSANCQPNSLAQASAPTSAMSPSEALKNFSFNFGNASNLSSLFRFGTSSSFSAVNNNALPSSSSSHAAAAGASVRDGSSNSQSRHFSSPFTAYRESRKGNSSNNNSPRISER